MNSTLLVSDCQGGVIASLTGINDETLHLEVRPAGVIKYLTRAMKFCQVDNNSECISVIKQLSGPRLHKPEKSLASRFLLRHLLTSCLSPFPESNNSLQGVLQCCYVHFTCASSLEPPVCLFCYGSCHHMSTVLKSEESF